MKNTHKAIGLLGGMGPSASVFLHKVLIELSVKHFGALEGNEFPEIIHDSIPVPDFISDEEKKRQALSLLSDRVLRLSRLGTIGSFGIACNTAHVLLPQLQKITSIPFISMIDEVSSSIPLDIKKVGLLATPTTIRSDIYQKAIGKKDKKVIVPTRSELVIIESIIRNVIRNKLLRKDKERLIVIANSLQKRGAEGIILGCTELPLIFPKNFSFPVFNSIEILAMSLLKTSSPKGGDLYEKYM